MLAQAAAYKERRRRGEPSFFDFSFEYPADELTSFSQIEDGSHDLVEVRVVQPSGQRGMHAKRGIKAGEWLVVSQPVAAYWDAEKGAEFPRDSEHVPSRDEGEAKQGSPDSSDLVGSGDTNRDTKREGELVLRVLEKIKERSSVWTDTVSKMYPRDMAEATELPTWSCSDASISSRIQVEMEGLSLLALFESQNEVTCDQIALRLPLIVRYNSFGMETSPEQFVYDHDRDGMDFLSGVGLYGPVLSYFNHSCRPNASKFAVGDVMILFANRDIAAGDELCHSYLSHEYLCESDETRRSILANDFELDGDPVSAERPKKKLKSDNERQRPGDAICVPPFVMAKCFDPETGRLYKPKGPGLDFSCNSRYLFPIWKARVLEAQGRSNKHRGDKKNGLEHALPAWEAAIGFAESTFPPLDARKVALYAQAALCASVNAFQDWAKVALRTNGCRVGDRTKATAYAEKALEMHDEIFGGGEDRFLKRYVDELLRSGKPRRQMSAAQLLSNMEDMWDFGNECWEGLHA